MLVSTSRAEGSDIHLVGEGAREMAVTFDRAQLVEFWSSDEADSLIGEDGPIYYWLNLADTGSEDVLPAFRAVVDDLNGRGLDWSELAGEGSAGEVAIAARGLEMLGVYAPEDAPVAYLDAFCEELTRRRWTGHLTRFDQPDYPWRPTASDPTISTMLGYGTVAHLSGMPAGGLGAINVWQVNRELLVRVVDLALDWLDAAPYPLCYDESFTWNPTRQQARDVLLAQPPTAITRRALSRLSESQIGHPDLPPAASGRSGRTAVFARGHLLLTDHDFGVPLDDRLAEHHRLLTTRSDGAYFGLTRATVGHDPTTIYGIEDERRIGPPHIPPRQHPGHTPGLPDAYYAQLFPTQWLTQTWDPAPWIREDLPDGRTVLTARDASDWFATRPEAHGGEGWVDHGPTGATRDAARDSLRGLLQRPDPRIRP